MRFATILIIVIYDIFFCFDDSNEVHPFRDNTHKDPYTMINEGKTLLKEGDLVLRLNTDPSSQYLKNFNRFDKKYSHAGIVLYDNGYPFVYHIINGEENPDGKLKKDSLARFCDPRKNMAYGIFRYDIYADDIKNMKNLIRQWCEAGVKFDSVFNPATDDRMYCSEMVSKALAGATNKRILISTTRPSVNEAAFFSMYMHLPYAYTSNLQIIAIDNLYTNRYCHLIKEYSY